MPDSRKTRRLGRTCLALLAIGLLSYGFSGNTTQAHRATDEFKAQTAPPVYAYDKHQVQVPIASQSFMDMMRGGHR